MLAQLGQELADDHLRVGLGETALFQVVDLNQQALAQIPGSDADWILRLEYTQDRLPSLDVNVQLVGNILWLDTQIPFVVK